MRNPDEDLPSSKASYALYGPGDTERPSGAPAVDPDRERGRTPFKKDYARLLHAPSFRRLQGKTQLYPGHESDFFRNRLTHSLEVAQIASGIAERLNAEIQAGGNPEVHLDLDLVEFAALAHDLGHPPFGHNGEKALDEQMRAYGGFEGNAQTLHILANVERKEVLVGGGFRADFGLDLCYRSFASVLKYDAPIQLDRTDASKLQKGYYLVEAPLVGEIKRRVAPGFTGAFKTVECHIMDLADDIAYSTYDLEDSLHAKFLTPLALIEALATDEQVRTTVLGKTNESLLKNGYAAITEVELLDTAVNIFGEDAFPEESTGGSKADPAGQNALRGVAYLTANNSLTKTLSRNRFTSWRVGKLIEKTEFTLNDDFPALSVVKLSREALLDVEILKHLNYELVIRSPRLAVVEYRGKQLVRDIFTALRNSDGSLLPEDWKERYRSAKRLANFSDQRVICDFIAGMTDRYAAEFHAAIAGEGASIFKPL